MGRIIMRILWVIVGLCAVVAMLIFVGGISEVETVFDLVSIVSISMSLVIPPYVLARACEKFRSTE